MAEPTVCVLGLACCGLEAAVGIADRAGPQPDTAHTSAGSGSVLVLAGTVTDKLAQRLRATYDEPSKPVSVVAYGACAISGGPYWDSYCVIPGVEQFVPVDIAVPGCPPRPADLRAALVQLDGRPPREGGA